MFPKNYLKIVLSWGICLFASKSFHVRFSAMNSCVCFFAWQRWWYWLWKGEEKFVGQNRWRKTQNWELSRESFLTKLSFGLFGAKHPTHALCPGEAQRVVVDSILNRKDQMKKRKRIQCGSTNDDDRRSRKYGEGKTMVGFVAFFQNWERRKDLCTT